jgi:8-oxo-dGTP pyrophosphatase MutT (NUDIX family)
MPPSRSHIRHTTDAYLARNPGERAGIALLFEALDGPDDPTNRATLPAHVTCSAVVLDQNNAVLHIHHKATRKTLAPGGHNEPGDQDLPSAALRELFEEVGIPREAVTPFPGFETVPLDIDVHGIGANPVKGEPGHVHIDFRFVFRLVATHQAVHCSEETTGYEWRPAEQTAAPALRAKLALLTPATHT